MSTARRRLELEAELIKALAHPLRLEILESLRDGEHCVCEFVEKFELEQPNVSQHLAVLRRQGLVGCRREGMRTIYFVEHPEVFDLLDAAKKLLMARMRGAIGVLENAGR